ncbi:MAG: hypothetical protein WDN75_00270 [Bacteroidota bacterium]
MLDRSLSVTQTASTNFLQQQVTNNLGRYFMLSFTYSLNKQLASENNGNQRRRGNGGWDEKRGKADETINTFAVKNSRRSRRFR